jgi:stalled ribosome rescue protein Dom34
MSEVAYLMRKRGYRRGYPVAVLIGLEDYQAVLWRVFSNVVKPHAALRLGGGRSDGKALYSFHEAIVDTLRSVLNEGVKSIVVVAPLKTGFADVFLDHVRKHDAWLVDPKGSNSATFGVLVGSAGKPHEVAELVKTKAFRDLIGKTTAADADRVVNTLEKWLNDENVARILYSLEEVEDIIYGKWANRKVKPEYLMLTDEYLQKSHERSRLSRLLQISNNKNVKTVIVETDTPAGKRLTQLGGLVCLVSSAQTDGGH